jgi:hypothetical protein
MPPQSHIVASNAGAELQAQSDQCCIHPRLGFGARLGAVAALLAASSFLPALGCGGVFSARRTAAFMRRSISSSLSWSAGNSDIGSIP